MKIVFTMDQIYLHGGIEKVMATKANYFADVLGYEVFIVTTEQKNNEPCYHFSLKIKFIDLNVNYLRTKSYFSFKNLKKVPSHFFKWYKTLKKINPDFIIVCNIAFDFYWAPFFVKRIKKIKEFHASRFFMEQNRSRVTGLKKFGYKVNDFIESRYDKIVLLNEDERKFYRSNNLEVIPNPINIRDEKQIALSSKKAIAAGRIAPVKGFESVIAIWKIVIEKYPKWQLDIFGQGEEKYINELNNLIQSNDLVNHVFIHDAVSDLQERMLEYSFYVMTSLTECFPMILLESLSIGLPIVSYDCPTGPKNIIKNKEDGFLVENNNKDEFAISIFALIENPILKSEMGKNAKKNVKRFSNENVMKIWKDLLINLKPKK
ncbi:glycosyltransferase family 4 protein [Flavobacterium jejuense]|uniref:Glycosyltransferase family 4 protein n=1 Tax=Flavobacterium jejuense TaxID=1544455 RepID=A0ABX0IRJ1_9FLAO|nr:glycosyltransferase family 4 protein [Flavobacterium jejuense]NHN26148.1 glycosyltransferase family 4 protein [Flavobacterium jejuense]